MGNERLPHFGPDGEIVFLTAESNPNYLERLNPDGRSHSKVIPYPVHEIQSVSARHTWLAAIVIFPNGKAGVPLVTAIPLRGGSRVDSAGITAWLAGHRVESFCTFRWRRPP